jgi:hypothetical protein
MMFGFEYMAWDNMRQRCASKKKRAYGGRGIRVCARWRWFKNFLFDMGLMPSPNHSLDRIDNDDHYRPSNCRWVTEDVQRSNRYHSGKEVK